LSAYFCEGKLSHCCQMAYFQTKTPTFVYFGRPCSRRCWYFYYHFFNFTAKWYILWPFGTFCGHLVIFPFWCVVPRIIWQPWRTLLHKILDSVTGMYFWEIFQKPPTICRALLFHFYVVVQYFISLN
jgi:hypothetical protein